MQKTLLILAAGVGSRYGGNKQLDAVGPRGEIIMDFTIQDALEAGFDDVVLVIREELQSLFEDHFDRETRKYLRYVYQEIPGGKRTKPWGTGHALFSCRESIWNPFVIVNADDLYGKRSMKLASELIDEYIAPEQWGMIGYRLEDTLSDFGGVSRGICSVNGSGLLTRIAETHQINRDGDLITGNYEDEPVILDKNATVSMNCWVLHPSIFELCETEWQKFQELHGDSEKKEFLIPDLVFTAIQRELAVVRVVQTSDKWLGITFKEDLDDVRKKVREIRG